jgi:hypothetical protein
VKWPPAWELVSCNKGSWKGAAVQRGLEHGSKRIFIVRSRFQETSSEDAVDVTYSVAICKMWKSAMMV